MEPTPTLRSHLDSVEQAWRQVEKQIVNDSNFPRLSQLIHLGPQSKFLGDMRSNETSTRFRTSFILIKPHYPPGLII